MTAPPAEARAWGVPRRREGAKHQPRTETPACKPPSDWVLARDRNRHAGNHSENHTTYLGRAAPGQHHVAQRQQLLLLALQQKRARGRGGSRLAGRWKLQRRRERFPPMLPRAYDTHSLPHDEIHKGNRPKHRVSDIVAHFLPHHEIRKKIDLKG